MRSLFLRWNSELLNISEEQSRHSSTYYFQTPLFNLQLTFNRKESEHIFIENKKRFLSDFQNKDSDAILIVLSIVFYDRKYFFSISKILFRLDENRMKEKTAWL